MPARYDVYESPMPDNEERNLHVRLVTDGTISTSKLAEQISHSSSMTRGDVASVLSSLSYYIGEALSEGNRVHIDGLGYFQMNIKCPPAKKESEIRGDKVKFKSVSFRAEQQLKSQLQEVQFLRAEKRSIRSMKYTSEEIDELLEKHFEENEYLTRSIFEKLCHVTEFTARKWLMKLTEEGKLIKRGALNSPFYVKRK